MIALWLIVPLTIFMAWLAGFFQGAWQEQGRIERYAQEQLDYERHKRTHIGGINGVSL